MHAKLSNHRQAPRKVRLVADMIKGKKVSQALVELEHGVKKAAEPVAKLIKSAVANARQHDESISEDNLVIENITVDKGMTFRRFRPRARGRASKIDRETSHVSLILSEQQKDEKERSQKLKEEVAIEDAKK